MNESREYASESVVTSIMANERKGWMVPMTRAQAEELWACRRERRFPSPAVFCYTPPAEPTWRRFEEQPTMEK